MIKQTIIRCLIEDGEELGSHVGILNESYVLNTILQILIFLDYKVILIKYLLKIRILRDENRNRGICVL